MKRRADVLISYAYWTDAVQNHPLVKAKKVNLFLDSGAFSVASGKCKITVDDYIYFLKNNKHLLWNYINLDVLGDAEQTEHNYQKIISAGLKPIPVFTRDFGISNTERLERLEKICEDSDFICIGGLVGDKSKAANNYMYKIARYLHRKKKRFHFLGVGKTSILQAVRPYSCDSSAAKIINAWAQLRLFYNGRMHHFGRYKTKKLTAEKKKVLNFYRIPPISVVNNDLFKSENDRYRRPINFRSMQYWADYMARVFNVRYFHAISTDLDLVNSVLINYFPKLLED